MLVNATQMPETEVISRTLSVGLAARLAHRSNNLRNLGVFATTLIDILESEEDDAKRGMLLASFVSEMARTT